MCNSGVLQVPHSMSRLQGILRQRCPRCQRGAIFRTPLWRGILALHERCPVCALKYDREPGYFLGAMYISYMLMLPPAVLICLTIWHFSGWPFDVVVVATFIAVLPLVPSVMRWARVLWLYFDRTLDPD